VKCSVKNTGTLSSSSAYYFLMQLNGVTSNGSNKGLYGNGATATSDSAGSASYTRIGFETDSRTNSVNTFGNAEIYIPNYRSSNYKSVSVDTVSENNETYAYAYLGAALFTDTNPITSISFYSESNNFTQYSTFYLYGVAKLGTTPAIVPYATGGDTIMTDGTYWYHAFKSSGTFTPAKGLSCDVLVVAGGGGGGGRRGAGAGAGGLLAFTTQSIASNSAQTITIGAGGSGGDGGATGSPAPTQGSNSQFASLTASVGGGVGGRCARHHDVLLPASI
jgi:hypothetical protein